ncbi:FAD-dependent thymidylate synthase [Streptomyces cadmiisoli]
MEATDHEYDPSGFDEGDGFRNLDITNDCDSVPVFGGRNCYQSWGKPNPATATEMGYLKNILSHEHYSVLEHSSATFYVTGVSRNLTHELIRHRHLSYSELSQRYVDMENARIVIPPALRQEHGGEVMGPLPWGAVRDYEATVRRLMAQGLKRKQAREAARYILPGGTETRIVVTGNMRAWRDSIYKRFNVSADAEIREFGGSLLTQLKEIAPGCFQDMDNTEPFGGK